MFQLQMQSDPYPEVSEMASTILTYIKVKATSKVHPASAAGIGSAATLPTKGLQFPRSNSLSTSSHSAPNSPQTKATVNIQQKLLEQKQRL